MKPSHRAAVGTPSSQQQGRPRPRFAAAVNRILISVAFASGPALSGAAPAAPVTEPTLPFDRDLINRYSVDGRPRSIAIRQGRDVWLGYDLEQAKLFKIWRAISGKP